MRLCTVAVLTAAQRLAGSADRMPLSTCRKRARDKAPSHCYSWLSDARLTNPSGEHHETGLHFDTRKKALQRSAHKSAKHTGPLLLRVKNYATMAGDTAANQQIPGKR